MRGGKRQGWTFGGGGGGGWTGVSGGDCGRLEEQFKKGVGGGEKGRGRLMKVTGGGEEMG